MKRFRIIALFALALASIFGTQSAFAQQTGFGLPIYGFDAPTTQEAEQVQAQPTLDVQPQIVPIAPPQQEDYEKNAASNVFGAQLFTGAFALHRPDQIADAEGAKTQMWT